MLNLWGFNHYGAIRCFQAAIQEDENCCFGYWGIAYAYGPHYNAIDIGESQYSSGLEYLKLAEIKAEFGN